MNHVVYSYFYFIDQEMCRARYIDPDISIEQQFDDVFTEYLLLTASVKFEMNHGIEIPDEYMDYSQTPRQLAERISQLPRVDDKDFEKFLLYKEMVLTSGGRLN